MNTVLRVMEKVWRVVRSRAFSVVLLSAFCAVIAAYVSLNMSAVSDSDSDRVVLTLHSDPYRAGALPDDAQDVNSLIDDSADELSGPFTADGIVTVHITADGISTLFPMDAEATVADAIERSGVYVGEYDKTVPDADAPLSDGIQIEVNRVEYREYTTTESIAYETEILYTNTLAKGKTQMRNAGENGVKTYTYRECYENGEIIGTELVKEEITKQPVNASKLVGTVTGTPVSAAPFDIKLDEAGQPVSYKKVLSGKATAYTSDRGDSGAWTSWAGKARVGVVAVDPNLIPYGTKLYIVSADGSYVYGYAIAGDTGGALRSGRVVVDLYYNTYEECIRFGRRDMNVYVLD